MSLSAGGCFCGAVRYEVSGPLRDVTYCHCSKCRRWHGHFGAYTAAERKDFAITKSDGLKWHTVSPTVKRGFCTECGSSLLFEEASDARISICAGTLDDPTGLKSRAHIYVASKGDYYELNDSLMKRD